MKADWFMRIDDDCVFETKGWLAKFMRLATTHRSKYGRDAVFSPTVHGLRFPVDAIGDVRFGKWDEVLELPPPPKIYGDLRAVWHFARGMARAGRGELAAARAESGPRASRLLPLSQAGHRFP